jgi:hypothetical protein
MDDPDPAFDWSSWVPGWAWGGADGWADPGRWVEVVDGLGGENVRRAAKEWWEEQVNGRPGGKGRKGKGKLGKKGKQGKTSRVR